MNGDKGGRGAGSEKASAAVKGTASFSKFMVVLQTIADEPGRLDVTCLAKALPYPRGTLYRILAALVAEGLVAENAENGTFHLGHRLIRLASKSWESFDLRTVARAHLEALRDATGETVHLAVPGGEGMVYIDKLESPRAVGMMSRIGTQVEFHSTSVGKAYLAALPEERCRETVSRLTLRPRTARTLTEPQALMREIDATRTRGSSFDDEENESDIRCFGGAILDRTGEPVGAVSLSIPIYRYDDETARLYAQKVRETVKAISRDLGAMIEP